MAPWMMMMSVSQLKGSGGVERVEIANRNLEYTYLCKVFAE